MTLLTVLPRPYTGLRLAFTLLLRRYLQGKMSLLCHFDISFNHEAGFLRDTIVSAFRRMGTSSGPGSVVCEP